MLINLKLDQAMLKDVDASLEKHRYSTRTEFIRDAIRRRLTDLEKEEAIRKLESFKGILKGKGKNISDDEARMIVGKELEKELEKIGLK
jgi:Arc/MetJ-type ribon-helix-helix transcriptional regulator